MCAYMYVFCLLNYLKVTNVMPLYWLQWVSLKSKDVFLFNRSIVIEVRDFNLDAILLSNLCAVFHFAPHLSDVVYGNFCVTSGGT